MDDQWQQREWEWERDLEEEEHDGEEDGTKKYWGCRSNEKSSSSSETGDDEIEADIKSILP